MSFIFNIMKKKKLLISFLLIIIIFLSFGMLTIIGLHSLGNLTRMIYAHPLVVSNASLRAALNITKMHRSMKDIVLSQSQDEIENILSDIDENQLKVFQQLDIIKNNILGDEGKELEKKARQLFENWKPIRESVLKLLNSGNKNEAILITKTNGANHVAILEEAMLELTLYARNKADYFIKILEIKQSNLETISIILTFFGVLISLSIAFIVIKLVLNKEILLIDKNNKLQIALDEVKTLRGILPICSFCKKIRNDKGYYEQIEGYIHKHSGVDFSHTICPSCMKEHYSEEYDNIVRDKNNALKI